MGRFRIGLLLSALVAAGACDRLAGTEVGNPEITVAARFGILVTDTAASIAGMSLKVMGMGWNVGSDSGACWNDPAGHRMDFLDSGTALPAVTVKNGEWSKAEMMLQAADSAAGLPDNAGFSEWSDPRYIKLIKKSGSDTVRALFLLPAGLKIRLGFAKASIDAWRDDNHMTVLVYFDAGKWAAGLTEAPFTWRMDGRHARYILLAPGENAEAYAALMALLPQSFMADSAAMP